jgi:hypothetical protein
MGYYFIFSNLDLYSVHSLHSGFLHKKPIFGSEQVGKKGHSSKFSVMDKSTPLLILMTNSICFC